MSLPSFLPALRLVLKFVVESDVFKRIVIVVLDWLFCGAEKNGRRFVEKARNRKKKTVDTISDDDLFEK